MRFFMLDVGEEKYGDAILALSDTKSILIDGAHPRDFEKRGSAPSIPEQLSKLLGRPAPMQLDLLVVTHCHSDHIGCLPKLVADNIITAKWALLADEELGFPRVGAEDALVDEVALSVVAALREEPRTEFRNDTEIRDFVADAANLESSYRTMIDALERGGCRVIRFGGTDHAKTRRALDQLESAFADFPFKVLGPRKEHLGICAEAIRDFTRDARRAARSRAAAGPGSPDFAGDEVALYRDLSGMRSPTDAFRLPDDVTRFLDRPGKGAALNDQSIVVKIGEGAGAALLTGDMQFAAAEIAGLDGPMTALLDAVEAAGPYMFVKLPHHASYNGLDEAVLHRFQDTSVFGISTGRGDPDHPFPAVIELLRTRTPRATWLRTDKNGQVAILIKDGQVEVEKARGRLNDASPNTDDSAPAIASGPEGSSRPVAHATAALGQAPAGRTAYRSDDAIVEVVARIPHTATRVTLTVEVEPRGATRSTEPASSIGGSVQLEKANGGTKAGPRPAEQARKLAAGRELEKLLFVTHEPRLAANVGSTEARQAIRMVQDAGKAVIDVRDAGEPYSVVRAELIRTGAKGVVLIGGYDVLPSIRYDVLPSELREQMGDNSDPDNFIVWSDQIYGDRDGDGFGELPVSRIPDGRSSQLLMNALCTCHRRPSARLFGLRNVARTFAGRIFELMGAPPPDMMVSAPLRSDQFDEGDLDAAAIYVMLHGSDSDTSKFWGELERGGTIEALNVAKIPDPCGSVVFAGSCWGALTVRTPASQYRDGAPLPSITPEQSIALSFLRGGARAFIGCTGAHYSPVDVEPKLGLNYFSSPLHEAFWSHFLREQLPPAEALFKAKVDYIRGMPHGRRSLEEQAIEYKILREFTCLGLGW